MSSPLLTQTTLDQPFWLDPASRNCPMDGLQWYPSAVCRNGVCKRALRVFWCPERPSLHCNATEANSSSTGGVKVREPDFVNVYLGKIDIERQPPSR
jgi:hypothetical protein